MIRLPLLFTILHLLSSVECFYLPGLAPKSYKEADNVPINVNVLTSTFSAINYDYYDESFGFCKPKDGIIQQGESLGTVLFGDRIANSAVQASMLKNQSCNVMCQTTVSKDQAKFINARIKENYAINWFVDQLPAATMRIRRIGDKVQEEFVSIGFELGELRGQQNDGKVSAPKAALHNHYFIQIAYHPITDEKGVKYNRVVGVLVWAESRQTPVKDGKADCTSNDPVYLDETKENSVVYTYSVEWVPSSVSWATRWDVYLRIKDSKIHWFSLINSTVILMFLSGMVTMILLRALHKDIARYNQSEEEAQEDFGWKLVHGDVFRPPKHRMLLSVLIGNGVQLFVMTLVALVFALFGFMSPSNHGFLLNLMLALYVLNGCLAGYVSSKMYKMLMGENWKRNALLTAFLLPAAVFSLYFVMNFFLIAAHSSSAVPFGSFCVLMLMWFAVSVPLCFIGSYFGLTKKKIEHPVRTNQIPRQIPQEVFYLRPIPSILMGGVLPFGAIFIELYFIMTSIWFHQTYYVFGFLFLVFLVLVLTCAQVTVLMCYFHLCSEDYRWWWRSFLTSGASAFYVFLYGVFYYFSRLGSTNLTTTVLYLGWNLILSVLFFTLTGTIGFAASFAFVRKIYSSIKVD